MMILISMTIYKYAEYAYQFCRIPFDVTIGVAVFQKAMDKMDYPPPTNVGSLRGVVGIFAYNAKWIPHFSNKIQPLVNATPFSLDMLERVQRRATKMIPKLRNISYEMRLKECGLTTLETRRLRGDQIEVFKILNRYENIDRNIFSRSKKREGL